MFFLRSLFYSFFKSFGEFLVDVCANKDCGHGKCNPKNGGQCECFRNKTMCFESPEEGKPCTSDKSLFFTIEQ